MSVRVRKLLIADLHLIFSKLLNLTQTSNLTSRVIDNIVLMQFSVCVYENSSDSLWHKNSEERWCIKVMQNTFKKANTHLFLWNRKGRDEVGWQFIIKNIGLFKAHLKTYFSCFKRFSFVNIGLNQHLINRCCLLSNGFTLNTISDW